MPIRPQTPGGCSKLQPRAYLKDLEVGGSLLPASTAAMTMKKVVDALAALIRLLA